MIDNLIAFKILYMLVTPFSETDAFKLGVIDENGKLIKKLSDLKTQEEKDSYNVLVRLVFNIKRLINKTPGGESKIKNIAAAYFLVKESLSLNLSNDEIVERYISLTKEDMTLVEETITVINFISLFEDAPANATGAAVSSDEPVVHKKKKIHDFKEFKNVVKRC